MAAITLALEDSVAELERALDGLAELIGVELECDIVRDPGFDMNAYLNECICTPGKCVCGTPEPDDPPVTPGAWLLTREPGEEPTPY